MINIRKYSIGATSRSHDKLCEYENEICELRDNYLLRTGKDMFVANTRHESNISYIVYNTDWQLWKESTYLDSYNHVEYGGCIIHNYANDGNQVNCYPFKFAAPMLYCGKNNRIYAGNLPAIQIHSHPYFDKNGNIHKTSVFPSIADYWHSRDIVSILVTFRGIVVYKLTGHIPKKFVDIGFVYGGAPGMYYKFYSWSRIYKYQVRNCLVSPSSFMMFPKTPKIKKSLYY